MTTTTDKMNSASTSTASLISSYPSSSKPKNYEQAFGNLSSSFGFAGSVVPVPCVQNTSNSNSNWSSSSWRKHTSSFFSSAEKRKQDSKVAAQQEKQQVAAYSANAQSQSQSQPKKNFEAAYGDLASRYGFGNGPKSSKV